MFEESADDQVKDMARKHVLLLDSLDQRDVLRKVMQIFRDKTGRCPTSWTELREAFRVLSIPVDVNGSPVDPTGMPYVLNSGTCEVELNPKSEIPIK